MKARSYLVAFVLVAVLYSCKGNDEAKTPHFDLAAFNAFAQQYVGWLHTNFGQYFKAEIPQGHVRVKLISTDLKTTDSVLHPTVGEVVYETTISTDTGIDVLQLLERQQFVRDSGHWVMVKHYSTVTINATGGGYAVGVEREQTVDQKYVLLSQGIASQ